MGSGYVFPDSPRGKGDSAGLPEAVQNPLHSRSGNHQQGKHQGPCGDDFKGGGAGNDPLAGTYGRARMAEMEAYH